LNPELIRITFKDSVHREQKTQHFSITKITWLVLFMDIITVYSENHTKPINTVCGKNTVIDVKAGSFHWASKG
jgi:hypothetical protein